MHKVRRQFLHKDGRMYMRGQVFDSDDRQILNHLLEMRLIEAVKDQDQTEGLEVATTKRRNRKNSD